MNLATLENVGLTRKEAEIYVALLRLGESPIADVIKETKTHPQVVYSTLDGLREKGLLITSYRRHRQYVRAEDPAVLKRIEEEKLRTLSGLIPDLQALQKASPEAVVRVTKGNEAARQDRERAVELLQKGETLYILGGGAGGKYIEVMREQHLETERKRLKKGVIKRMLAFENQRELIAETNAQNELSEYRFLGEDYTTPTSLVVYGSYSTTIIWLAEPIVITVESAEVAEGYTHYFEALWKIAKR